MRRVRSRASPTIAKAIPPSRIRPAAKISASCQVFRPPPPVLVVSGDRRGEAQGEHERPEDEQGPEADRHGRRV